TTPSLAAASSLATAPDAAMPRAWLGVASAAHVRIGRAQGFMRLNHGKRTALARMRPGDRIVSYSPATEMRGKDRLQSFTAIGIVRDADPYQVAMGDAETAWQRDVDWLPATETPIVPLLDRLDLTAGKPNWGYQLRFGLVELSATDFDTIAAAMDVRERIAS
ncbi:MAG: EVE domain-containing protein, partial [Thermomicrobiales bacterium]